MPVLAGCGRLARPSAGVLAPRRSSWSSQATLRSVHPQLNRCCTASAWKGHDDDGSYKIDADASTPPQQYRYKRVMLKISGEALEGQHRFGIDPMVLQRIAREVAEASRSGVQVAIVVGGGNFFRGVNRWAGLDRPTADYVGMLATIMNAITLQSAVESEGVEVRVQTAIEMREVAEPYIRRRAVRHLERGRVVIFGGGTGNPFFTTDTASALRAAEISAEVYLKATQVDGVYDSDPKQNPAAQRYSHISYRKCVVDDLKVLDESAFALCKENDIPVLVFDLHRSGNILKALQGCESVGTVVNGEPDYPEDKLPATPYYTASPPPPGFHPSDLPLEDQHAAPYYADPAAEEAEEAADAAIAAREARQEAAEGPQEGAGWKVAETAAGPSGEPIVVVHRPKQVPPEEQLQKSRERNVPEPV